MSPQRNSIDNRVRAATGLLILACAPGSRMSTPCKDSPLNHLGSCAPFEIAQIYAARGMADQAFDWPNRAIARYDTGLWWFAGDPFLNNIRNE